MSRDPRLALAVGAGRATAVASRLLGRGGGTTYPGLVARRLDPGLLAKLVRPPRGAVLVTGTNGKTTTTGMLVRALRQAGPAVLTNDTGSNIMNGLVGAAIARPSWGRRHPADIAVFEVDELWPEQVVRPCAPRMVVVLNFLRDQLDRSGELETTAARVGAALRRLPEGARVVANADDPLVWEQCRELPGVVPVGIDADDLTLPSLPHSADARACPGCDAPLRFDRVLLAHCGRYHCPNGDFGRPALAAAVTSLRAPALDALQLGLDDGTELEVAVGGVYNAYNTVLAYAAARQLGLSTPVVREKRHHRSRGLPNRPSVAIALLLSSSPCMEASSCGRLGSVPASRNASWPRGWAATRALSHAGRASAHRRPLRPSAMRAPPAASISIGGWSRGTPTWNE